jgi:hypothetical protein
VNLETATIEAAIIAPTPAEAMGYHRRSAAIFLVSSMIFIISACIFAVVAFKFDTSASNLGASALILMVSAINFAMSASIFLPDSVSALSVMMFPPVRGELYKYGSSSDNAEKRQLEKNAKTAGKNT